MKKIMIYSMVVMMMASILVGCSGNKNQLVGKWQDKYDTVTFQSDGTFTALVHWPGGEYTVDGNHVQLMCPFIGNKDYYFTLEDKILTFYSDEEMTQKKVEFVAFGTDLSCLEETK